MSNIGFRSIWRLYRDANEFLAAHFGLPTLLDVNVDNWTSYHWKIEPNESGHNTLYLDRRSDIAPDTAMYEIEISSEHMSEDGLKLFIGRAYNGKVGAVVELKKQVLE